MKSTPLQERFTGKVGQPTSSGCVLWLGAHDKDGYGHIRFNGKIIRAHRAALELRLGRPLLINEWALHSCDTPACVNPDHLRIGTNSDNKIDSAMRGRCRGQRLSVADVLAIRAFRAKGMLTPDLGRQFQISKRHAAKICQGTAWRHVA